ncbi:MAG TPA: DUF6782 family putative metallopeptidase [Gemmatimonadales bacterium]|nr:DUF6782 family putative metallopeptidase [Gemmatimonadales bacterium]
MDALKWGGGTLLVALGTALALQKSCRARAETVRTRAALAQEVKEIAPSVERLTGLRFKRPPVVVRRDRDQVRDYLLHKFEEDLPEGEREGAQAAYRLFGLLPDTVDLRTALLDVLSEQVAGYFDPDSNELFLPTDLDPSVERTTIAHELVHALQHQYTNLDSIVRQKQANDRRTAAQSVLEGQAVLVQTQVAMPEKTLAEYPSFWDTKGTILGLQAQMPEFSRAPLWLRESLIFPYLAGADFVRWFDTRYPGKHPFGALMPTSTEQILDPARYAARDAPVTLAFERGGPDTVRYEDDLGEFEGGLLVDELLGDTVSSPAAGDVGPAQTAAGWAGDRYQVLGAAANALVWYSVWDTPAARDAFQRKLERAWSKRSAPGRRSSITPLTVNGRPALRLVDAPRDWKGWSRLPQVSVTRG